jgi:hypothetical protein
MLGEAGLVEVIAIVGYCTRIGNFPNKFEVLVPKDVTPPLADRLLVESRRLRQPAFQ